MIRLNPYLAFTNTGKEAMEFYHSIFGGKIVINTFKESGMPFQPGEENKLMHGMVETENGLAIMASDTPDNVEHHVGTNVSLSLSGDDEVLREYWNKLSQGGTIRQPLEQAPWGDTFGMLTDKFGIEWMVNISPKA